jgi:hypothetical protein
MSSTLTYTDPSKLDAVTITNPPTYGHTQSGYGGKIPTRYLVRYAGRWRRVYTMIYGNGGTAYVVVNGQNHILSPETEHMIQDQVADQ